MTLLPRILYLTQAGTVHDERFLVKLRDRGFPALYVSLARDGNLNVPGLPCHSLGLSQGGGVGHMMHRYLGSVIAVPRLRKLIREFKPDIIHSGFVTTAGVVAALSGFRPILSMPWGSDILLQPQTSVFRRKLAQFVLRRADLITCDAEAVKARILDLAPRSPDEVVVFPWGIDVTRFRPDPALRAATRRELALENAEVLVTTRSLAPIYGIEDYIRCLPEVFKARPAAVSLVIGDGPLRTHLESLTASLGLSPRVRFLGRVANADLPRYLNAADLYVSPSYSDGTSLSLLEAMACALPVVVTDIPAILEWVTDGTHGRVVPIRNTHELKKAVVALLSDSTLCQRAALENRRVIEHRADWDRNFAKLEAMYERLKPLSPKARGASP